MSWRHLLLLEDSDMSDETRLPNETNMSQAAGRTYIFDDPKTVQRGLRVFYALCIVLAGADFIIHRHSVMDWEKLPGFYALYGFVACVVLVLLAKVMRVVLMRREDYYDG